jgi:hypothetical protein
MPAPAVPVYPDEDGAARIGTRMTAQHTPDAPASTIIANSMWSNQRFQASKSL